MPTWLKNLYRKNRGKGSGEVVSPVFVVGCGRSGTTMLFQLLSQHSMLVPTTGHPDGEDHVGWVKHGDCLISGLGQCHINHGHTGYHYCLYMDEANVTTAVRERMHAYYRDEVLAGQQGRVLNKCPHLSNKLRYVHAIFPDAKIIHIVREPLPVISSWIKIMDTQPYQLLYLPEIDYPCLWVSPLPDNYTEGSFDRYERMLPGKNPEKMLAEYWSAVNRDVLRQRDFIGGSLLTVRYEDLCVNPKGTLDEIADFCGLDKFDTLPTLPDGRPVTNDSNAKYIDTLDASAISECLEITREVRNIFGYIHE